MGLTVHPSGVVPSSQRRSPVVSSSSTWIPAGGNHTCTARDAGVTPETGGIALRIETLIQVLRTWSR